MGVYFFHHSAILRNPFRPAVSLASRYMAPPLCHGVASEAERLNWCFPVSSCNHSSYGLRPTCAAVVSYLCCVWTSGLYTIKCLAWRHPVPWLRTGMSRGAGPMDGNEGPPPADHDAAPPDVTMGDADRPATKWVTERRTFERCRLSRSGWLFPWQLATWHLRSVMA